jgi:hypothetical protein
LTGRRVSDYRYKNKDLGVHNQRKEGNAETSRESNFIRKDGKSECAHECITVTVQKKRSVSWSTASEQKPQIAWESVHGKEIVARTMINNQKKKWRKRLLNRR